MAERFCRVFTHSRFFNTATSARRRASGGRTGGKSSPISSRSFVLIQSSSLPLSFLEEEETVFRYDVHMNGR
jgi:hypothetical protein